jgi:ADP-ribose pyrophosphatase YjhB (NUDIX family)
MAEFQAIYGVFINQSEETLLFRRTQYRTYRRGEYDLMGGEIQEGETPLQAFLRESEEKLALKPKLYYPITEPTVTLEGRDWGIRYLFLSRDPLEQIQIDPKKYDGYGWYSQGQIGQMDLNSVVKQVLDEVSKRRQLARELTAVLGITGDPPDSYIDNLIDLAEQRLVSQYQDGPNPESAFNDGICLIRAWAIEGEPSLAKEFDQAVKDSTFEDPWELKNALDNLHSGFYRHPENQFLNFDCEGSLRNLIYSL